MIQYKHYHDFEEGYKDSVSKTAEAADIEIFSSLYAFSRSDDSCFAYLPKNGKGYFSQTTNKGDIFSHGLAGEIVSLGKGYAAEYIGQLETKYRKEGEEGGYLPEGKLPYRRAECDLSLARGLQPVFARVVDTLVYTDKPVVIVGNNADALVKYVKVALLLLPPQFANAIGFSVCPESLPSFFGDPTSEIGKYIRLVATDGDVASDDNWVVLNVCEGYKDEGFGELRPYAKAIDKMQRYLLDGQGSRLNALVNGVCPCFTPDGRVDGEQLEAAICVHNFTSENDLATAIALIKAKEKDSKGAIRASLLVDAAKKIFEKETLTSEEEGLIEKARNYAGVEEYIKEDCGKYAFKKMVKGESLTEAQRADIVQTIGSLSSEELTPDGELLRPVFAIGVKRNVSTLRVFAEAYQKTGNEDVLKLVFRYVHILDTYNYKKENGKSFDREIMDVAAEYPEKQNELLSAILLSCYLPSVCSRASEKQKTKVRLRTFAEYASEKTKGNVEFFRFALKVKNKVERLAEACFEEVRGADDFELLEKADLKEKTDALSFEERLTLVNGDEQKTSDYVALQDALLIKLSDVDEVKENVSHNRNFAAYKEFLERYESVLNETTEIKNHIETLEQSGKLSDKIAEYRRLFVLGSYNSMSYAQRGRIATKAKNKLGGDREYIVKKATKTEEGRDDVRATLEKSDSPFKEKLALSESIIDELRSNGKVGKTINNTLDARYLSFSYAFGILFMAIALVALAVTPVLSAVLLGGKIGTRLGEFFKFYHVLVVFYIGVLNVAAYIVNWSRSNRNRPWALKKACKVSFLFGLLPVLLYAVAYAVTYFVL